MARPKTQSGSPLPVWSKVPESVIDTLLLRYLDHTKVDPATATVPGAPGATGCWIWQKSLDEKGYGTIEVFGVKHNAHRFFWSLCHRRWAGKQIIRHTCTHSKACVNIAHLKRGSYAQSN